MLCLECGEREAVVDGLCKECFVKKTKFTYLPPHMELTMCPHCGAVRFKGEWKRLDEGEMIRELIERNMDILHDYDSMEVDFSMGESDREIPLDVRIRISYRGIEVIEEHVSEVSIKYESCPRCNRFFGNYFEAILQIRGLRDGELEELVSFAHSRLENYARKNENLFVTKEEGKHGGWDIYISDKKEARKVAEDISRRYGATVKESPHIVGRKDGRDVYRMTYSVRLPEYREGDVVEVDGVYSVVRNTSSHYLKLLSLRDGKERSVDVRKHKVSMVRRRDELEEGMVLFSQGNEVQIMDQDYKVLEVKTPFPVKSGERVKFFRKDDEVFVVP